MEDRRKISVLVCTGNLGNEQPDPESFEAWIPTDGLCADVIKKDPKYPIVQDYEYLTVNTNGTAPSVGEGVTNNNSNNNNTNDPPSLQFDLIAVGMQEATFEPPDEGKDSSSIIRTPIPIVSPLLNKGVQTVADWTTNRDYTKKSRNYLPVNLSEWSSGTAMLHAMFDSRLPSYRKVVSYQRGQMRLEIFCLEEGLHVEVVHVAAQNTGRAGLANKGGIVTELIINHTTRLAFCTVHLEAHEGAAKYAMRCASLADIFKGTREKIHDASLTSHYSFVCGDLNFRTDLGDRDLSDEEHMQHVRDLVQAKDWANLNRIDELHGALRKKDCLVGFNTLACPFPPTFKLEREIGYIYSDKRRMSYTDRVLWKTGHGLEHGVIPLAYEPIDECSSSDHKPVRAAFDVVLNEPLRVRPRMNRRATVLKLGNLMRRRKSRQEQRRDSESIANNEKLHLFVARMSAQIDTTRHVSLPDNLYLCLVSTPHDALKFHIPRKDKIKRTLFLKSLTSTFVRDGIKTKTMRGWPRSSSRSGSITPDWGDEDIHCEIKTHDHHGTSIDLTGAMLRLTLMGNNSLGREDVLYGTCSINLANLIRSCPRMHKDHARLKREDQDQQTTGRRAHRMSLKNIMPGFGEPPPPTSHDGDSPPSSGRSTHRMSWRNFVPGFSADGEAPSSNLDDSPIQTLEVDEPLVRNGQITGHLRCTVETWWMDAATARLVGMAPTTQTALGDSTLRGTLGARHLRGSQRAIPA